jgi:hypothetical protein
MSRAKVIAVAIRWAGGESRPHDPHDIQLVQQAGQWGLPPLLSGEMEEDWIRKVQRALKQEREYP